MKIKLMNYTAISIVFSLFCMVNGASYQLQLINQAASSGDIERVSSILSHQPILVNYHGARGFTPLHSAIQGGKYQVVATLLGYENIRINDVDDSGATPLHAAVAKDDQRSAGALLCKGAAFDMQDKEGNTPLHCAVMKGREGIVRRLLESGANKTLLNNQHETPLQLAIQSKQQAIINLLQPRRSFFAWLIPSCRSIVQGIRSLPFKGKTFVYRAVKSRTFYVAAAITALAGCSIFMRVKGLAALSVVAPK